MVRDPAHAAAVSAAASGLEDVILRTPLVPLHGYAAERDILLKPEIHQAVTSFKIRGVFHAVASLPEEERARGLSTVSAGNTAQALAWCGRFFGVSAPTPQPTANAPDPRSESAMFFDPVRRVVMLYGGSGANRYSDTWEYRIP